MKMVIRGAKVPETESRPRNPAANCQVGTMTG